MSEQNKQLVSEFWATASKNDVDGLAAFYRQDVAYHGTQGDERRGRAAALELARTYLSAFPDMHLEVEQLVAEGDCVAARVRATGTHTGELLGMAPTGRRVDLRWIMNMMRIADGRIVEEWEVWDQTDLMRQLGAA